MKETIVHNAEAIARDWLTLALFGLGVTFSPEQYIGGMILALAGASLATKLDSESKRLGIWGTLIAAFFISHLAVLVAHIFYASVSPQAVMAVSGFASRYIARFLLRFLQRVLTRSDAISDRIVDRVFPPDPNAPLAPPPSSEEPPA